LVLETVILHDLEKPGQDKRLPITMKGTFIRIAGITQQDRLLLEYVGPVPSPNLIQMADYSLLSASTTVHNSTIRLPMSSGVLDVALSSKGDRLAWLLGYDDEPPGFLWWLHQLLPSFPWHPQRRVGLWVSRLDGSGMAEIGHQPALPDGQQEVSHLQWLPGDKQISFLYKDALWTVPAD
jgi:hypothetical protein